MRDLLTMIAAICAVAGLTLACSSSLFNQGRSWLDGFVSGCLAAAAITLLGSLAVFSLML